MAREMQQITCSFEELESTEWLQEELPLALRLRRSWSADDIWVLRKECEDDCESNPDSSVERSTCAKFSDDDVSTCDADDRSSISDESGIGDCTGLVSPSLDWAAEMQAFEAPKSQDNFAMTSESFTALSGQWTSTLGKLDGSSEKNVIGPLGNKATPETRQNVGSAHKKKRGSARASGKASVSESAKDKLVKSVKNFQRSDPEAWFRYTAEYGQNIRDPSRHTEQFLADFLSQHNLGLSQNVTTPQGKSRTTPTKMSAPPGNFASPPGVVCAAPRTLCIPLGAAAN